MKKVFRQKPFNSRIAVSIRKASVSSACWLFWKVANAVSATASAAILIKIIVSFNLRENFRMSASEFITCLSVLFVSINTANLSLENLKAEKTQPADEMIENIRLGCLVSRQVDFFSKGPYFHRKTLGSRFAVSNHN